jgi:hypothetical protein
MNAQTTIEPAGIRGLNASQDYSELKQEAVRLARRILEALDDGGLEPYGVDWGHVGDIAATRDDLRQASDRLFQEGEWE